MHSHTRPRCDFWFMCCTQGSLDERSRSSFHAPPIRASVQRRASFIQKKSAWPPCTGHPIRRSNVLWRVRSVLGTIFIPAAAKSHVRGVRLGVLRTECTPPPLTTVWRLVTSRPPPARGVAGKGAALEIAVDIPRIRFNWHWWRHGGCGCVRRGAPTDHAAMGTGVGGGP